MKTSFWVSGRLNGWVRAGWPGHMKFAVNNIVRFYGGESRFAIHDDPGAGRMAIHDTQSENRNITNDTTSDKPPIIYIQIAHTWNAFK